MAVFGLPVRIYATPFPRHGHKAYNREKVTSSQKVKAKQSRNRGSRHFRACNLPLSEEVEALRQALHHVSA